MGVSEIFAALRRRWYIVLVGLALTAYGGWYVYGSNPPDYTARSLVLLLPPVATGEAVGSNPFLQLGGLELTARVVVATYSGTTFQDEVARVSPTAEVEVSMDESTRGGVIAVDVKDRGEKNSLDVLDYVTSTVSERLTSLQQEVGVLDVEAVRSMVLAKDVEAKPEFQSLIRALVLAIGGGIGITLLLSLILDALLVRFGRRRRRPRGQKHAASAGDPEQASGAVGSPLDEATPTLGVPSKRATTRRVTPGDPPQRRDTAP